MRAGDVNNQDSKVDETNLYEISKDIGNLNNTIRQFKLTDLYRTSPSHTPTTRMHSLFKCTWIIFQDESIWWYIKQITINFKRLELNKIFFSATVELIWKLATERNLRNPQILKN